MVMPNHIHGIVIIRPETPTVGAPPRARPSDSGQARGPAPTSNETANDRVETSLSDLVHRFKTLTTKRYVDGVKQAAWPEFPARLWQRNYYEHIIRNEPDLSRIREYIVNNPLQWHLDRENPAVASL